MHIEAELVVELVGSCISYEVVPRKIESSSLVGLVQVESSSLVELLQVESSSELRIQFRVVAP